MKKTIIPITIIIILASIASAETKTLFDGWMYSNNATTLKDGKTFTISLNNDFEKIYATIPNKNSIIVKNNSCEIQDYYEVCYNGTRYARMDYQRDIEIRQAHTTLKQKTSKINITKKLTKTNPLVGEEIWVITKITNDQDRQAKNVQFYDNYTTNIKITNVEGCELTDNTIQWKGELNIAQTKECKYTLKPTTNLSYTNTAIATYNNGETDTSTSTTTTITTQKHALEIKTNTNNTTPNLADEFWINITLENTNAEYDINVDEFRINLPTGIKITAIKGTNDQTWNGKLLKTQDQKTKQIQIKLQTQQTGKQTINLTGKYTINNLANTNTQQITINTPNITPPTILFLKLENTTKQEENKKDIIIQNLNEKHTFYNIKTTIEQTDMQITLTTPTITELKPGMDQKIGELTINQTPGKHTIKSYVTSQTEYGEILQTNHTQTTTTTQTQQKNQTTPTNTTTKTQEKKQETITKNIDLAGNVYKVSFTKESLIFGIPLIFILAFTLRYMIKKHKQKNDPLGILENNEND